MMLTALRTVQSLALVLLPLALTVWVYYPLSLVERPAVYFIYSSILLYLSDGLALLAVAAWAVTWALDPQPWPARWPSLVTAALFGLALLATLSAVWSVDHRFSLYTALHLWLLFGLYLCMGSRPDAWRWVAIGSALALLLQSLVGGYQFLAQSTAFLQPLHLPWPGVVDASMHGASVVQLLDGRRWLRAYGTLPHPNILGGMLMVFIAATALLFLKDGRKKAWSVALVGLGAGVLVLTFSRSAWLGLGAGALVLAFKRRWLERTRLLALATVVLVGALCAVVPLRLLVFTRVSGTPVSTELRSTGERISLAAESLSVIRAHPLGGVGAGAYVLAKSQGALPGAPFVEPVHNLPLLASAELGLGGGLLMLLAGVAALWSMRRARSPQAIVFSAALAGLLVVGLLDHYQWSLAPGRTLLWLVLGVWAGQISQQATV